jgi:hypothetical protein
VRPWPYDKFDCLYEDVRPGSPEVLSVIEDRRREYGELSGDKS